MELSGISGVVALPLFVLQCYVHARLGSRNVVISSFCNCACRKFYERLLFGVGEDPQHRMCVCVCLGSWVC